MGSWQDNFVNTFPDAIVVVDRRGVIRQWNSRAEEYFGWCAAEAIGASVDSRISVSRFADSAARDWNYLREQIGAGRSLRTILQARGRGSETCSFELTAFSQPDDQDLIACFREWYSPLQDDVHPKELPANAIEFSGSGDRFPLIPTPIEQEKSTSEAFRSCLEVVCKEIDWPWAHGWIVDDSGKRLVSTAIWHGDASEKAVAAANLWWGRSLQLGEGVSGRAWELHRPVWGSQEEIRKPQGEAPWPMFLPKTCLAIPVFVDGDVLAVLQFFHQDRIEEDSRVVAATRLHVLELQRFLEGRRWQQLRSFLAAIVESTSDAIIGKDLQGQILSWNHGAELVYGYSEDEAVGRSIKLILPDELEQEEPEILKAVQSGKPLTGFETIRRHKSGKLLNVSLTISPIRDQDGELMGAATIERDITSLKQTIQDLYDREERLRLLMEASGEAIYGIDTLGNCIFANRVCAKMLRYRSSTDLLGRDMHALIHHHHADGRPYPASECPIQSAIAAGKSVHILNDVFWREDGSRFPAEYWASPIRRGSEIVGAVVIFEDSTERIAAERVRGELAAIVESSGDAIIGKSLDGTITSWNRGAVQLYGFTTDEAIGRNYRDCLLGRLIDAEDAVDTSNADWMTRTLETQRTRKDGGIIEVGITESAIRDSQGALIGTSSIERDISQRKRREAELERAREQAEIANRAKSEFVANISHELRTPMNAVLGMLRIALEEPLPDALRDYLSTASESAENLLLNLDDLLDFSRMEAGRFELEPDPFRFQETLENAVRPLADRAQEKGIDLSLDIDQGIPDQLEGDALRFRQVITNLVGNAIKFTDRGEIVVRAEVAESSNDSILLGIRVKDSGVGISPEDLDRIFQPFTQVDASTTRSRGGSGLGLAICRELAEKMGGGISATSELDVGTEFYFTSRFRTLPGSDHPAALTDFHGARILIVDDGARSREVLTKMLSIWHIDVVATGTVEEAIRVLETSKERNSRFSLAIVDYRMPGWNGIDLIHHLRETSRNLELLIMVSPAEKLALARHSGKLPVAAFLSRPLTHSDLFDALTRVFQGTLKDEDHSRILSRKAATPLCLLAAEDTPANQKVIRAILNRRGHTVRIVENGQQAVACVEEQPFDAVLMDIQMPQMDGIQATLEIRKKGGRFAEIPIIAMTAHARREDRNRCLSAGMTGYVSKPIDAEKLLRLIEKLAFRSSPERLSPPTTVEQVETTISSSAPIVDLAMAKKRMGGDQDILDEMIGAFLEDAPVLMSELEQACEANDDVAAHRAAHSLKGLSATFDATPLVNAAFRLEQFAKSQGLLSETPLLKDVQNELERVIQLLSTQTRDQ